MTPQEFLESLQAFLDFTLFKLNNTPVTILTLILFVAFIAGFSIIGGFVKRVLNKRILPRFINDSGLSYTLSRISQYIIVIIGVFVSFQFLGIDLTGITIILGFLSVGIGFGLQNITSNFISGLIVLFERPISVGDRVMVNNIEGDVIEINIRSTKIRTLNNVSIIVPNSEFVSKDVVNYSHGDPSYRLDVKVGVSYGSDLNKVIQALREIAEEHDGVFKNPKPDIHLTEFGDSSWNMELRVWIADVKNYPIIRNDLNQAIVHKFRAYNIEIPFPQRDINFKNTLPEK